MLFFKRTIIYCICVCLALTELYSQKPALDTSVFDKWPSVSDVKISPDGKFVVYAITNQSENSKYNYLLKSISREEEMELGNSNITNSAFSNDSRFFIYLSGDTLGILSIKSKTKESILDVVSFKVASQGSDIYLVYRDKRNNLVINFLNEETSYSFASVTNYSISESGDILTFVESISKEGSLYEKLHLYNFRKRQSVIAWTGEKCLQHKIDERDSAVALISSKKKSVDSSYNSLWYYSLSANTLTLLAVDTSGNYKNLSIAKILEFSSNSKNILIDCRERQYERLRLPSVDLNIWTYFDSKLQSQQLQEIAPKSYKFSVNVKNLRSIRIENENESLKSSFAKELILNEFVLVERKEGDCDPTESNWNRKCNKSTFLLSICDGSKSNLYNLREKSNIVVSPRGQFILYYDRLYKNYFSYEFMTRKTRNVTQSILANWANNYKNDLPTSWYVTRGVAGWMQNDSLALLYDNFDIWKIDLTNKRKPINITNGMGLLNNRIFSLAFPYKNPFKNDDDIILNAFDLDSKENGFYKVNVQEGQNLELLTMGPYLYDVVNNPYVPDGVNFTPIKAMSSTTYIVQRMSSKASPNYFVTKDFKTFAPVTKNHPERHYNWLTTELIHWSGLDGKQFQGVLYRPENFDSNKKYPLIFYCYERMSDGLNAYIKPEYSDGRLNIPWFVSNGYLVFAPDIHYKIGQTGESAYAAVVSAVNHLSKIPYVNIKRLGLQGISFGSIQINYLITHTNLFAAVCSSSGVYDFISGYGSLSKNGRSLQTIYEIGQNRIGSSLVDRPDLYIKNSPILKVKNIQTPLLMMHTTDDGVCPFSNALEFFLACRRAGKKVWLLQYNKGNHGIWGNEGVDFTIRMRQFFDYYLKDKAPPFWMTRGIPANQKGFDNGLRLDQNGEIQGNLLSNQKQ